MSQQPTTLARVATGAAAGLVAGVVASLVMDRFQALTQPSSADEGEPATQQAADAVARDATGEPLSDDAKPIGGQAVHYGLGAALGLSYGIAAEFAPRVTTGLGTIYATGVWALLDEAAVPAVGLGDPPWKSQPAVQAYGLVSHLVFGVSAELTRRLARAALESASGQHISRKDHR